MCGLIRDSAAMFLELDLRYGIRMLYSSFQENDYSQSYSSCKVGKNKSLGRSFFSSLWYLLIWSFILKLIWPKCAEVAKMQEKSYVVCFSHCRHCVQEKFPSWKLSTGRENLKMSINLETLKKPRNSRKWNKCCRRSEIFFIWREDRTTEGK